MAYELKQAAELSQRIELTGRERLTVTGVELLVEGHIDGLNFEDAPARKSSFFSRLLG